MKKILITVMIMFGMLGVGSLSAQEIQGVNQELLIANEESMPATSEDEQLMPMTDEGAVPTLYGAAGSEVISDAQDQENTPTLIVVGIIIIAIIIYILIRSKKSK